LPETLKVLFVCSGNICRSPLAKVLAEQIFREEGLEFDWIDSAGTLGIEDQPASPHALDAAKVKELDLSQHRSKGLSANLLDESTHLVVMAPEHAREVLLQRPDAESRLVRIWKYTDRKGRLKAIDDPINHPYKAYMTCRDNLSECIRNWARTLRAKG